LMFLARKQRAHSGFDLNQSCLAITRVHREAYSQQMSVNPAEQEEKQLAILDRRIRTLQELGNAVDGEKSELFVDFLKDLRWRNCNDNKETIWALRNLWRDTVLQIDLDRDELAGAFQQMYIGWNKQASARNTVLVAHGFSTTVREVFKRGI